MEFEYRYESNDFIFPVHEFPGDEHIHTSEYAQCMDEGYISSVSTIAGAAEGYGLDVDTETFERWKRVASTSGMLDDLLDEHLDKHYSFEAYTALLDDPEKAYLEYPEVSYKLFNASRLLINSMSVLPEERLKPLLEAARYIGEASTLKSSTEPGSIYRSSRARGGRDR